MTEFTAAEIAGIVKAIEEPPKPLRKIAKVEFSPLTEELSKERGSFDHLKVNIEVLYGKTTLSLKELSNLHPGSVIPLPQEENGLVEVLANGKPFGRGEIVSIDGRFGIKLIHVV